MKKILLTWANWMLAYDFKKYCNQNSHPEFISGSLMFEIIPFDKIYVIQ